MRRLILYGAIGVVVLFIAAVGLLWLSLSSLGKSLAEEGVPGLTMGVIDVGWNRIKIDDFKYNGKGASVQARLGAHEVDARPTFLSFLRNDIEVANLDIQSPDFQLVRMPSSPGAGGGKPGPATTTATTEPGRVATFKQITLEGGSGVIEDRTVDGPPARVELKDIQLTVKDLKFPAQAGAVYTRGAATVKGQPDGQVNLSGWIDRVNQSADLKVTVTSLDLRLLRPYMRGRVRSLETAEGEADIQVDLTMLAGAYEANGVITLSDLNLIKNASERENFTGNLLRQYLKLKGNRVSAPFRVKGDLRSNQHQVDFGAILSGVLAEEVGPDALQKRFGTPSDLPKNLEDLKTRTKSLRDIFK